jgi:hypothetical protein
MNKRLLQLVIITAAILFVHSQPALAQSLRELGKISQNYIETGNDVRCYQIIYDPTKEKDYLLYTELLREKIKEQIKKRYRRHCGSGDVQLLFILNSDGSLYAFDVAPDMAGNSRLRDTAYYGLKDAAPFPRFPEALSYDRMAFSIVISFRKN